MAVAILSLFYSLWQTLLGWEGFFVKFFKMCYSLHGYPIMHLLGNVERIKLVNL